MVDNRSVLDSSSVSGYLMEPIRVNKDFQEAVKFAETLTFNTIFCHYAIIRIIIDVIHNQGSLLIKQFTRGCKKKLVMTISFSTEHCLMCVIHHKL